MWHNNYLTDDDYTVFAVFAQNLSYEVVYSLHRECYSYTCKLAHFAQMSSNFETQNSKYPK